MSFIQKVDSWGEKQQVKWVLLLRIMLGLLLWLKGFDFIRHTPGLEAMIMATRFKDSAHQLAFYVTWAHLFGGFMILIGLFTRIAVIIQLPALIGAVFFVGAAPGFTSGDPQLWLSIIVLILLIFFLFEGGGPYSIDRYIKRALL